MLTLIRLHNRPVPALYIPILNWIIVGGDMLRMRAVYIYKPQPDYQGMPSIGNQVGYFILSIEDCGRVSFAFRVGNRRIQFKFGPRWGFGYRFRWFGGLKLYKVWSAVTYKLLGTNRTEDRIIPRWDVA